MSQNLTAERPVAGTSTLDAVLELPAPLALHHGDELVGARIAYRLTGPAGAPVVAALGGISGHRVVAAPKGEGWWFRVVGAGLAVDTARYRVLGIDYLAGRGESTGPRSGGTFPPISAYDQAAALAHVLRHLGLALHALVGTSYGGMVALCFGERHADLVGRLVVMGATDRPQPLSTAWRSVQRQIVREAIERGEGAAGLKLARALAMTTYRTPAEFALRFGGPPVREAARYRFPVEEYLFARGDSYVQQYRPETFIALSESIDLFRIDASRVSTPTTLIAVREDQLVPLADVQALSRRIGGHCRLVEINSICGHDAFLTEGTMLKPIVEQALTETTQ